MRQSDPTRRSGKGALLLYGLLRWILASEYPSRPMSDEEFRTNLILAAKNGAKEWGWCDCPRCEGTGDYNGGRCSLCRGFGMLDDFGEPIA